MYLTVQDKIKAFNKKGNSLKEIKDSKELNDFRTTRRSRKYLIYNKIKNFINKFSSKK